MQQHRTNPQHGGWRISSLRRTATIALAVWMTASTTSAQTPQATLHQALAFLLTNRTIVTDDFVRDQAATTATSDAISAFLLIELNSLPVSTSAGGFTYRLDPTLGASLR